MDILAGFICSRWSPSLAVTDDRSEARVDPLAVLLVQGQNRQISGRGVEGNVEKAESKTETEQWVRAGGRQRGLP